MAGHLVDVQTRGGNLHSDKEKFCNDLNGPKNAENVRMAAENTTIFLDFQAEYEGSVPFTRSSLSAANTSIGVEAQHAPQAPVSRLMSIRGVAMKQEAIRVEPLSSYLANGRRRSRR